MKVNNTLVFPWIPLVFFIFLSLPVNAESFSPFVDKQGGIRLPDDFRQRMVHLGSWFVPEGDASGFHDVYADSRAVKTFRKTGKFPDGSTLVKELRVSRAGDYSTGRQVSYATAEIKQWFVMVKDEKKRFSGNQLWGDGWGWALFKPDQPGKNIATDYRQDCLGCHLPAKKTDFVYLEAYPSLRKD